MKSQYLHIHKDRSYYLFAVLILIANLIQAAYTELSDDESYYWMYSEQLDWGFFDHPPMIALLIKAGYWLWPNEFGVRFLTVLMSFGGLIIMKRLIGRNHPFQSLLIFMSIVLFQLYSFVAVPDAPLFFFTIWFFLVYDRFVNKPNVLRALLLGFIVAMMLYSKYHALLVITFVLLSNIRLLLKPLFYLVVATAVVLYLPHILWQIDNGYPSYIYHMLSKSHESYDPMHTLEYLGGLIVVFGPLVCYWVFRYGFTSKIDTPFNKALYFTGMGFPLFFLFSTLSSHGELNWTGIAALTFFILAMRNKKFKWTLPLKWAVGISIGAAIILRTHLMSEMAPITILEGSEFHKGKTWTEQIESVTGDYPVVFINSYQKASKFAFYSKGESHSMNNSRYRRNQFDLWPMESELQGRDVMVIPNWKESKFDTLLTERGTITYHLEKNFISYSKLLFDLDDNALSCESGDLIKLDLRCMNNYDKELIFSRSDNPYLNVEIIEQGELSHSIPLVDLADMTIPQGDSLMSVEFKAPDKPGIYYVKFVVQARWFPPFINSRFIRLEVN